MDSPIPASILEQLAALPDPRSPHRRQRHLLDMDCQREVAETVVAQGGDYLLALKGNQGQLHADVRALFEYGLQTSFVTPIDRAETLEKNHGRLERRTCWATSDPELLTYLDPTRRWTGLRSVVLAEARRTIGEVSTIEQRTA